uniref:Uncharacterized protein n=1 Tax=Loa loa TaxID=7209 RepID=A0A1I7W4T9_LOALO
MGQLATLVEESADYPREKNKDRCGKTLSMEPVEPVRGNASQHKVCRKRVILTYYTSQLPCVTEACKVEKRELNSLVKTLQEEVRAKDASIKVLRENLATMRFTIREFSCFIASKHPGTT